MTGRLGSLLPAFRSVRVGVVGEAMLDSYFHGEAERLSREAPVPIVTLGRRVDAPGGAANAAVNVAALGGRVRFVSVVGADEEAERLRDELRARGVGDAGLLTRADRATLAKCRILAGGQMLLRLDSGTTAPLDPATEDELIGHLDQLHRGSDALIVSDYGYGILTERLVARIGELQAAAPRTLVVDARDLTRYRRVGATAVKPNYGEAVRLLGEREVAEGRVRASQIGAQGGRLVAVTGARIVAVTLDTEGALVFERDQPAYRVYARPRSHSRAAGAGDTFVAALTLGLAAGLGTTASAELASAAAAIVVEKDGTACCSADELEAVLTSGGKRIDDLERLRSRVALYREQGRRIVFTNGCFDILHRGHITYLNRAKALGDVLVVGVNSDASVRRLKGPGRPINGLDDRLEVLEALSCVDHVVPFDADTPGELIRIVRPDVFAKGGDYRRETLPEAPLVESLGGSVQILPYLEDRSTSGVIARVRAAEPGPGSIPARPGLDSRPGERQVSGR
ncbi:MAG TPA: D-glycero-beta-D-manno-heptose 1-phosphate adenylyltransferase [Candidatus Limnocylindrales bacterium]|nr:D-glycero-beta-D-manno-heptose 1-phosphate adenylyltransferase [Candidatus Limnocylindrales bacterium]